MTKVEALVVDLVSDGEGGEDGEGAAAAGGPCPCGLPARAEPTPCPVCGRDPAARDGIEQPNVGRKRPRQDAAPRERRRERRRERWCREGPRFAFWQNRVREVDGRDLQHGEPDQLASVSIPELTCALAGLEEAWVSTFEMYGSATRFFEVFPALLCAKRLVLVHDKARDEGRQLSAAIQRIKPGALCFRPQLPPYGCNHSKAILLFYADCVRVIIHTANLIDEDLYHKSEGVWFQDFPLRSDGPAAGANDQFGKRLESYWAHVFKAKGQSAKAVATLRRFDFSAARALLVATVPGSHDAAAGWGQHGLAAALRELPAEQRRWPVVVQATSVGSQGKGTEPWLLGQFCRVALLRRDGPDGAPPLHFVFPTEEDCLASTLGQSHGLRVKEQDFEALRPHFCCWRASAAFPSRARAMPHIKSYLAYNPEDPSELSWMCLTSANASLAAWGQVTKAGKLYARSFELGVLFVPKVVGCQGLLAAPDAGRPDFAVLPVPYALPPRAYPAGQRPGPLGPVHQQGAQPWLAAA